MIPFTSDLGSTGVIKSVGVRGRGRGRPRGRVRGRAVSRLLQGEASSKEGTPPIYRNVIKGTGARGRPRQVDREALDEEGTPSVYKILVKRLKHYHDIKTGEVQINILENQSMDWRATQNLYPQDLDEIRRSMAFHPRMGELVLWASGIPTLARLEVNPSIGRIEVYDPETKKYNGFPEWRAGIVAQTPSTNDSLNYLELLKSKPNSKSITYTGFRLEACPDPNVVDRIQQQNHDYVQMHHIRPLSWWQIIFQDKDFEDLHPSIKNALSVTATVSLGLKTTFLGCWPRAIIDCNLIYIGAELYIKGDAVRFSQFDDENEVPKILVIEEIHLNLELTDENAANDKAPFAESANIAILGRAYALPPPERHSSITGLDPLTPMEVKEQLPLGLSGYGKWYSLHPPTRTTSIDFSRVLGRCHEATALSLLLNTETPTLTHDLSAIFSARAYSRSVDERIPNPTAADPNPWFFADTRAQALSLTSLNGEDISAFDETRYPKMWRGILRVIDGKATEQDRRDAKVLTRPRGPLKGSGKGKGKKPVGMVAMSGMTGMSGTSTEEEDGNDDGESSGVTVDEDDEIPARAERMKGVVMSSRGGRSEEESRGRSPGRRYSGW